MSIPIIFHAWKLSCSACFCSSKTEEVRDFPLNLRKLKLFLTSTSSYDVMSQPSAEAPGSNLVKLKFQSKPPNRRPQERDRIQKKAEEESRQKLERDRKKSILCRYAFQSMTIVFCS